MGTERHGGVLRAARRAGAGTRRDEIDVRRAAFDAVGRAQPAARPRRLPGLGDTGPVTTQQGGDRLAEAVSERTRVRRHSERGVYERSSIERIIDEALICHVGFVHDGQPFVLPTTHGRLGDTVYLHGAVASTMLRNLSRGLPVCVTFTLVDGIVLARSVYNHSMNYRSAVVVGTAVDVRDPDEKLRALHAITEHVMPGRWGDARVPNDVELKATRVLRLSLVEASAKVRGGDPSDDPEDMTLPVWAGVVPTAVRFGQPVPAPEMAPGAPVPPYVDARVAAANQG